MSKKLMDRVEDLLFDELKGRCTDTIPVGFRQFEIYDSGGFNIVPAVLSNPVLLGAIPELRFEGVYLDVGFEDVRTSTYLTGRTPSVEPNITKNEAVGPERRIFWPGLSSSAPTGSPFPVRDGFPQGLWPPACSGR